MTDDPTPFRSFAELCESLSLTASRNEKAHLISDFICAIRPDEVPVAIRFLTGHILNEEESKRVRIGGATLWKLARADSLQALLVSPNQRPTVLDVNGVINSIAALEGDARQQRAEALLEGLFSRLSELEKKYALRMISGEMEIGTGDGVALAAIAISSKLSLEKVRRAYMMLGDIGTVARLSVTDPDKIATAKIRIFTPVRPMLAEMATDVEEILRSHKHGTAFEYKYDGARIQIHKLANQVQIFSRRLSDVTSRIPDIAIQAKESIQSRQTIVEGEVVAVDSGRKPLPFQDLMRRLTRVHQITEAAQRIPVRLFLYDILLLNGVMLIDRSYSERRQILEHVVASEALASRVVSKDAEEIQRFFEKALAEGHEGLMAKALDSGYEVGRRGRKWFKLKKAESLDLVIVAAEWGHGRRTGWLSNYHLAVRDENSGAFLVVGKTFRGLTDEAFKEITKELQGLKTSETEFRVTVAPRIVVEVAYNEIQRSPHYRSGFALRFARIIKIRSDKALEDIDTLQKLRTLFDQQCTRKGTFSNSV